MLVINNGVYGARMAQMASIHGFNVVELTSPWTSPPELGQIDRMLRQDPAIEVVSLVHHETTTGLLNPVAAIGEIVKQYGRVLLVDSISGLGGENIDLAAAGIGLCVGTANKCIQGLPGVSFVLVKNTEMQRMQDFPRGPCIFICQRCTSISSARAHPLPPRFKSCMRLTKPCRSCSRKGCTTHRALPDSCAPAAGWLRIPGAEVSPTPSSALQYYHVA